MTLHGRDRDGIRGALGSPHTLRCVIKRTISVERRLKRSGHESYLVTLRMLQDASPEGGVAGGGVRSAAGAVGAVGAIRRPAAATAALLAAIQRASAVFSLFVDGVGAPPFAQLPLPALSGPCADRDRGASRSAPARHRGDQC